MEFCSTRANTKTSINKVHGIPYQIYKQKVKKTVSVAIEKKCWHDKNLGNAVYLTTVVYFILNIIVSFYY